MNSVDVELMYHILGRLDALSYPLFEHALPDGFYHLLDAIKEDLEAIIKRNRER